MFKIFNIIYTKFKSILLVRNNRAWYKGCSKPVYRVCVRSGRSVPLLGICMFHSNGLVTTVKQSEFYTPYTNLL